MLTQEAGARSEQKALDYLMAQGLSCISRNYRCRLGEIDLVMRDGAYLVFVEVRARANRNFGGGLASITYAKRQKIIKTASYYLLAHQQYDQQLIRFDAVSIDGQAGVISWLKDAFSVD